MTKRLVELELSTWKALDAVAPSPCNRCAGDCCSIYVVELTEADLERIAKRFKISLYEAKLRYADESHIEPDEYPYVLNRLIEAKGSERMWCVFAKPVGGGKHICGIYEDRPSVCREYNEKNCEMQRIVV